MPQYGSVLINDPKLKDKLEFAMAEGRAFVVLGVENDIAAVFQRLASEAAALASGQEAAATERSDRSHARRLGAVGEEEDDDDDSDEYMAPVSPVIKKAWLYSCEYTFSP